ncbi:MAG: 2-oxoglutarate oxidoreductase [Candidatus Rokubacteria bacterium]|nr:2-oxoglutarate oxidoreductase [Candidatus Rokubacteria bacterium]
MALHKVFDRPAALTDALYAYCPGCTHGIAQRLFGEVVEEMGLIERAVAVIGSGCLSASRQVFNFDTVKALHGRAPSVATGIKRAHPELLVFTVQGDGDLAGIGAADVIHAATRGERISTCFMNNATFGMTGGQMGPTTLPGQKTTTTPDGRDPLLDGHPVRITEMLAMAQGAAYVARTALNLPTNVIRTKMAIRRAFETQLAGLGFSVLEILSACPTDWHLTPVEALRWMEHMIAAAPLGELKVPEGRAR